MNRIERRDMMDESELKWLGLFAWPELDATRDHGK